LDIHSSILRVIANAMYGFHLDAPHKNPVRDQRDTSVLMNVASKADYLGMPILTKMAVQKLVAVGVDTLDVAFRLESLAGLYVSGDGERTVWSTAQSAATAFIGENLVEAGAHPQFPQLSAGVLSKVMEYANRQRGFSFSKLHWENSDNERGTGSEPQVTEGSGYRLSVRRGAVSVRTPEEAEYAIGWIYYPEWGQVTSVGGFEHSIFALKHDFGWEYRDFPLKKVQIRIGLSGLEVITRSIITNWLPNQPNQSNQPTLLNQPNLPHLPNQPNRPSRVAQAVSALGIPAMLDGGAAAPLRKYLVKYVAHGFNTLQDHTSLFGLSKQVISEILSHDDLAIKGEEIRVLRCALAWARANPSESPEDVIQAVRFPYIPHSKICQTASSVS
jgi:hypothetical protein